MDIEWNNIFDNQEINSTQKPATIMGDKFLFFDIECSDGQHICSFGYVLTDGELNVLEKRDIVINPEARFQTGRAGFDPNIHFAYNVTEFLKAPIFSKVSKEIFDIMQRDNPIILGHSVDNDFKFLLQACDRYGLDMPEFEFFDTQLMYRLINDVGTQSLENIAKQLEIATDCMLHKSDDDALMTKLIFEKMCQVQNISPKALLAEYIHTKGKVQFQTISPQHPLYKTLSVFEHPHTKERVPFKEHTNSKVYTNTKEHVASKVHTHTKEHTQSTSDIQYGKILVYDTNPKTLFKSQISHYKTNKKITSTSLMYHKNIYFDHSVLDEYLYQSWTLIELLIDNGATLVDDLGQVNIFVYNGDEDCRAAQWLKYNRPNKVQICTIHQVCKMLDTTLESLPNPPRSNHRIAFDTIQAKTQNEIHSSHFYHHNNHHHHSTNHHHVNNKKNKPKPPTNVTTSTTTSLGELFKAKGLSGSTDE